MIDQAAIDRILDASQIVDVVSEFVTLRRRVVNYIGLCPFHNEKTPSFYVYPETQSFYCFGCGAGGDVITFVKKINALSYPEAVKMLAARAGMPEPEEDDGTGRMRSRILSMNKEAARFFHACLNSSVDEAAQARAYWRRRGLDDRTIARFGLGYAPNDGQALYHFLRDRATPRPRWTPAACSSAARRGGSTACSGGGSSPPSLTCGGMSSPSAGG